MAKKVFTKIDDEHEKLLISLMIKESAIKQQKHMEELHKRLHTYICNVHGYIMVFVAPSHQAVVDHILERGYMGGIGPMDLSDSIWELPSGGYDESKVTLICAGDRQPERDYEKRKEAEKNVGAGI